ncbi:FAD/NAD(P)-binding protein [Ilumatobacter sp.]|uniref:FAD/NAD(P)-binding protein n=1 Tax=Ilumatobacter sp. TaxID=1967498 RepID=UPI003AF5123E
MTLRVVPVEGPPPHFLPAQIGMVGAFGIGEAAISISSAPDERRHHEYTIRRAGAITGALTSLEPGDQLWVRGPFGRPWDLDLDGRDVLIAAGGIGLAPLRSAVHAIRAERQRYRSVTIVVGARSSTGLLYAGEYGRWRDAGIDVVTTIDRPEPGWTGRVGFVPDVVAALDVDPAATAALVCGPDVMMRLTARSLVEREVPAERVQLTLERNMQCGNGLCGHCQLGGVLVCRDGPVLPYSAIADPIAVEEL